MNSNATINSFTLRRAGAKRKAFERFNHMGVCSSYQRTLNMQSALGQDSDAIVMQWMSEIVEEEQKLPHDPINNTSF